MVNVERRDQHRSALFVLKHRKGHQVGPKDHHVSRRISMPHPPREQVGCRLRVGDYRRRGRFSEPTCQNAREQGIPQIWKSRRGVDLKDVSQIEVQGRKKTERHLWSGSAEGLDSSDLFERLRQRLSTIASEVQGVLRFEVGVHSVNWNLLELSVVVFFK